MVYNYEVDTDYRVLWRPVVEALGKMQHDLHSFVLKSLNSVSLDGGGLGLVLFVHCVFHCFELKYEECLGLRMGRHSKLATFICIRQSVMYRSILFDFETIFFSFASFIFSVSRVILKTDEAVGGRSTFIFVRHRVCYVKGWQRISENLTNYLCYKENKRRKNDQGNKKKSNLMRQERWETRINATILLSKP